MPPTADLLTAALKSGGLWTGYLGPKKHRLLIDGVIARAAVNVASSFGAPASEARDLTKAPRKQKPPTMNTLQKPPTYHVILL